MKINTLIKTQLNKNELVVIKTFICLKSFARQESLLREMSQNEMDEAYASLEIKKLLKTSKNGAVKATLDYEDNNLLISFNENTKETAKASLDETTKAYQDALAHLETLPKITVSWPNVSERDSFSEHTVKYLIEKLDRVSKLNSLFN